MSLTDPTQVVAQKYMTLQILCAGILVSLPIYGFVAWLVQQESPRGLAGGGAVPPVLPVALAAVAVVHLLAAAGVGRLIQRRATAAAHAEARAQGFVQATIVAFALREAAGIIGLVLSLLTGNLLWVLALGGLAALAMVAGWPRREQLAAIVASDRPPTIG